jgi:hypothetical protein
MTREIPLVLTHGLPRDGTFTGPELQHLVDEEEGLAMRKDRFDLLASKR